MEQKRSMEETSDAWTRNSNEAQTRSETTGVEEDVEPRKI